MARRLRGGAIAGAEHQEMVRAFKKDWRLIEVLDVDRELEAIIDRLALAHGLRGFDTVHLATALVIQLDFGNPITFASSDRRLAEAARREGFMVWPAKEPS
jgi:predicted nucleic acid-binding protein